MIAFYEPNPGGFPAKACRLFRLQRLHDRLVIRANLFEQESFSGMADEDESNPCRQAVATKFWQAEIAATIDSQHVHR
ncbi:MAG: hypothetical protein Rhob2KO_36450 [Rhodopirellula baltica]